MSNSSETSSDPVDAVLWLGLASAGASPGSSTDGAEDPSDRDRLERIACRLRAVVGSQALAQRWLRRRNAGLGDKPINLLKSAHGQIRLLQHLDRFANN